MFVKLYGKLILNIILYIVKFNKLRNFLEELVFISLFNIGSFWKIKYFWKEDLF